MSEDWIEHDGMGCPLAVGTRVRVRLRGGESLTHVITGKSHIPVMLIDGEIALNAWFWATDERPDLIGPSEHDVIAYVVLGKSDDERREDRQALFDSLKRVDGLPPETPYPPIDAPVKEAV